MQGITVELEDKLRKHQTLTEDEKFYLLHMKRLDLDFTVIEYLSDKLKDLYIKILDEHEDLIFKLMEDNKLEGWCWQTTESAIIFLNDNDYIGRGNLMFDEFTPKYYHSWICFSFNNIEYVFDPCLNVLCKKDDYYKIFKIKLKGRVIAKEVREELVKRINSYSEPIDEQSNFIRKIINIISGKYCERYYENSEGEIVVCGPENANTPLYRNNSGYKVEFDGEKIKKLTAHYLLHK